MNTVETITEWIRAGVVTVISSITYFYSHLTLVLISLIPSALRAYQMWNEDTPIWIEIAVEVTRLILFLLMIAWLSKSHLSRLRNKEFWHHLGKRCTRVLQKTWPGMFWGQILAFVLLLYVLTNFIIRVFVGYTLEPLMGLLDIQEYDPESAFYAYLFFIKNMSVIPVSMVFMQKLFGIGPIPEKAVENQVVLN